MADTSSSRGDGHAWFDPPVAGDGHAAEGNGHAADLPLIDAPVTAAPSRRRHPVAVDLYRRLRKQHESFWTSVYPLYMRREITRADVREVVQRGLEEAHGNYRIVAKLFNMEPHDYKRFLNFLRKHDCNVPFKDYR